MTNDLPTIAEHADIPDLPEPLTSFGATRLGDSIYLYGGNTGDAHGYDETNQSRTLYRYDLMSKADEWQAIATGPRVQGNALVAVGSEVILIGGFTATNQKGEPDNLVSQAAVIAFDADGTSRPLPDLPEPRSSFDAVADGPVIYVVGGWSLRGEDETVWRDTALRLDLSAESPTWETLPAPDFQRRALATVLHAGGLYVLGGMHPEDGPSVRVDTFDLDTHAWGRGPDIPGPAGKGPNMAGFGTAGVVLDGELLVTTMNGTVLRLDDAGWMPVGSLNRPRFFHRLVADGPRSALAIGGTSMEQGKYSAVDRITLP